MSGPQGPGGESRLVLPVAGMHCASCVAKVEGALRAVPGVREVSVDLPSRTVSVAFVPRSGLDAKVFRRAVERAGYDVLGEMGDRASAEALTLKAQDEEQARLLVRLQGSLALAAPLLAADWLNLSPYTALLLALPLQVWGGWHFHAGLYRSLLRRAADMNTLVSLSTWAAFLFSAYVVMFPETLPEAARHAQWEAVAGLVTLVTFGRWLETRTRGKTNEAVIRLMRLSPKTARVVREGREETVPIGEIEVGETLLVRPGEQVGMDGTVVSGHSAVDESLLTGESVPVEKSAGSRVLGGSLNKTGALTVEVKRPGSESALARIVAAVRESQATKPRVQRFADKAAEAFVPFVVLLGVSAAILWALHGPEPRVLYALTAMVSVFAVACPCALGLATPLAVVAGVGRAAELGILIRNADVLEKVTQLDVVLFDKTGTLTEGRPRVAEALPAKGVRRDDFLRAALAAEGSSEHPFAEAVAGFAREAGAKAPAVESFEVLPGRGTLARVNGRLIRAGSFAWLKQERVRLPPAPWRPPEGVSALGLARDGDFLGHFVLEDSLRPTAREAVAALKRMGLEVVLVSGDRNEAAYRTAEQVGIGRVFAEVLPEEKAAIIERLQAEGRKVAMVGEGFNDAPALSRADVGIALASGTDVAAEAADLTLMRHDLRTLAAAIALCRRARTVIRQNIFWAFAYNALLMPVAAGALFPHFGILLKPQYAGAAMALSSISVVLNSLRLRKARD